MATLSEDSDSWKANGIIRRDFRHTKGDPEVPGSRGRRKNTKKWCKGIVGREHDVRTYIENPHACHRDCSYLKENGGRGFHPWGTNRQVTKCVNCGMDRWNLDKRYKTDPIQQKLADKWCREGHLYDWVPREPVREWWGGYGDSYEYHRCVMCGKSSGKRPRKKQA